MEESEGPRILLIDIETAPSLGFYWQRYETNIIESVRNWYILCYCAKWLHGEHVTKGLCDFKGYKKGSEDDKELVKSIWKLLDKADIIVAQNGDCFDLKKINARFAYYNLPPPSPYKSVDTLKIARSKFAFESNKLDDLGEYLGLGRKLKHEGFDTWKGCMLGNTKSWRLMKNYNTQDVLLLEKVYLRFLPYITNHPNVGMWAIGSVCPKCGSHSLQSRGFYRGKTTMYRKVFCNNCRGWARAPVNEREGKPLVGV